MLPNQPLPQNDDAHDLIPPWLAAHIPMFYQQEDNEDPQVWCRYFTPDSSWTWYVLEYDPSERLCFGMVHGFEHELGYFSLDELEAVTGPLGLHIERDLYWLPKPLSAIE